MSHRIVLPTPSFCPFCIPNSVGLDGKLQTQNAIDGKGFCEAQGKDFATCPFPMDWDSARPTWRSQQWPTTHFTDEGQIQKLSVQERSSILWSKFTGDPELEPQILTTWLLQEISL